MFVYDCVAVSDLLLVEKEEKKGVGMDLVSMGRKWDRYRYEVLTCEVRIARKGAREEKKGKHEKAAFLTECRCCDCLFCCSLFSHFLVLACCFCLFCCSFLSLFLVRL